MTGSATAGAAFTVDAPAASATGTAVSSKAFAGTMAAGRRSREELLAIVFRPRVAATIASLPAITRVAGLEFPAIRYPERTAPFAEKPGSAGAMGSSGTAALVAATWPRSDSPACDWRAGNWLACVWVSGVLRGTLWLARILFPYASPAAAGFARMAPRSNCFRNSGTKSPKRL